MSATARVVDELPFERSPRGASFTGLSALLPAIAPQLEQLRAPGDRLEQLERELASLLATAAPRAWSSSRRPLMRILRAARREVRSRERQPVIGDLV